MANNYFQFKQFTIHQDRCAMKVTTDACLFGAWAGERVGSSESGVGSPEPGVMSRESGVGKILDIGTGTGLLSLMLAQKTTALIDAIEIDGDAFEQARENISASPWKERLNVYHADAGRFSFPNKYDIIISNPPFYENELRSPDEKKNVAHHGGLTMQQLLNSIKKNLSEGGYYFLLLPYKRIEEIENLINSIDLSITRKISVRQSVNHDYFRIMIGGRHKQDGQKMITGEISIRDDQQQYTKEFVALLKDYYLYL